MIEIKIFGTVPPCSRCKETEHRARQAAEQYPGKVSVAKFSAFEKEGKKYGIMMTPTVVVNDKVTAVGKIPSEDDFKKMIDKAIAEGSQA